MTETRRDYGRLSFWLETCGDDLRPRPSLDGSIEADVAILGAGFTGLWTAYYLLGRDPSLRVAVLEQAIAGFGASGRNGGWCLPRFSVSAAVLRERAGRDAARAVFDALGGAVDEIGRVTSEEGIDAHYARGGSLRVAFGPHHLPQLRKTQDAYAALGLGDRYRVLDAAETAARVRIAGAVGSIYDPGCAVVQPARLVRGLARAVERRGGVIYEETRVTGYEAGRSPRLVTLRGDVRARTIVLAGEAYLSRLRAVRRQLIPAYSMIVLTEPLREEQWAEIGWRNRECVYSCSLAFNYLTRTADGRLAFGGRGTPYQFGSRITEAYDVSQLEAGRLRDAVGRWFPSLRGVRFTHTWGGPFGISRDWMPSFSYDRETGLASARGYGGIGVATSNLGGRVLADLITGTESPLTRLAMVGHRSPNWEPEPLRWAAVRFVQGGYRRLDERSARTGKPPTGRSLVERLSRH